MDGSRFDEWTRRGFARALGIALAGLGGVAVRDAAGNKKRHKKRRRKDRCHQVNERCNRAGDCCNTLACEPVDGLSGYRCCRRQREGCSGEADCCGFLFCTPGGACDVPDSDRTLKSNFASIDPGDILERVRQIPIKTWDVERGSATVQHIGPPPQDFGAMFGVGASDRHIHVIDGQGVVLAAIQGAARLVAELHAECDSLRTRLDAQERLGYPVALPWEAAAAQGADHGPVSVRCSLPLFGSAPHPPRHNPRHCRPQSRRCH